VALDNTDSNIPLAGGQIPQSFQQGFAGAGQNLNQMLAMQLRMQQLRQVQQSENAMRQAFAPGNVDASGRPTQNAMGMLAQQDPRTFMQLQSQFGQIDQRKALTEAAQGKASQQHKATAYGIGVASLAAYSETLDKTNDPKLALQKMAEVRAQELDAAVADGSLSKDMAQRFPPPDPTLYRSHISAYQAQNTKPMTQGERVRAGQEDERLGIEKTRVGLEAKRINLEQDKQLFEGKDAQGKDRTVRMGDGGGWVDAESNEPVKGLKGIRKVGTKAEGATDKLSPSKEIAVVDKDGAVIDRFAARESATGAGWVRSDTGKPVEIPPGGKVDVGQAAGAVIGSRENVYIGRVLEAGITATADLENVSKMPVQVTSGMFGGRKQGPGLLDATKEVLANKVTTQDVQIYNSANAGMQRSLAAIESSGLAPSGAFTEQFQGLVIKEGDSQLTRLYKLANARQIVENGMAVIAANPRVAPEQKKLATTYLDRVKSAIPWTTSDVIALQTSEDPASTLHNLGVGKTGKGEKSEAAPPTATPKTGKAGSLDVTEAEYNKLPAGAAYTVPGDSAVRYKH
jgi:hypothetical protein